MKSCDFSLSDGSGSISSIQQTNPNAISGVRPIFEINTPPSGGVCDFNLPLPVQQNQRIAIRCRDWVDEHTPLRMTAYFYPDCPPDKDIATCNGINTNESMQRH